MKEVKFIRKGRTIKNLEANTSETFESINLAKKESHEIQMSKDSALGRGSVKVVE